MKARKVPDKDVDCKVAERRGESLFLTKRQFINQLIKAGWKKHEAEEEYQNIQEDKEGCP